MTSRVCSSNLLKSRQTCSDSDRARQAQREEAAVSSAAGQSARRPSHPPIRGAGACCYANMHHARFGRIEYSKKRVM
eukprot:6213175-Pleurochrysis_carterae.AAC.4